MALNARKVGGTSKFKRPPALEAGTYPARLVQVIDLGMQPQRPWQGQDKPPANMIMTTYEILDEFLTDEDGNEMTDKPRWVSEDFPLLSLDSDRAKSTQRYTAMDQDLEYDGDWSQLVGTPCIVTLSADKDRNGKKDQDGNTIVYNNISSVQPMRAKDAAKAEPLKNPTKVFDMGEPNLDVFLSLPDWLRDKIKSSLEYAGSALEDILSKVDEKEEAEKRRASNKQEGEPTKEEEKSDPPKSDDNDDEDW